MYLWGKILRNRWKILGENPGRISQELLAEISGEASWETLGGVSGKSRMYPH